MIAAPLFARGAVRRRAAILHSTTSLAVVGRILRMSCCPNAAHPEDSPYLFLSRGLDRKRGREARGGIAAHVDVKPARLRPEGHVRAPEREVGRREREDHVARLPG